MEDMMHIKIVCTAMVKDEEFESLYKYLLERGAEIQIDRKGNHIGASIAEITILNDPE